MNAVLRLPVESFSSKENLTALQQEFDAVFNALFRGRHIVPLPHACLVPVPLGFFAPDDLGQITDATTGNPNHPEHQLEQLGWLTITPIPHTHWRQLKLRKQSCRWHAELHRMWLGEDGTIFAGRQHACGIGVWDVSKNPLQDPYRMKSITLAPGDCEHSGTYGSFRIKRNNIRAELHIAGRPAYQLNPDDLGLLDLPQDDSVVTIGQPLITVSGGQPVNIGRILWRNGQPVRARPVRDHLSADRHQYLTRAVIAFFGWLVRAGESKWKPRVWPEVRLGFDNLQRLRDLITSEGSVPAQLSQNGIRYTLEETRTRLLEEAFVRGHIPAASLPHSFSKVASRRVVVLPEGPDTINDVTVYPIDLTTWDHFWHNHNGITWRLKPTDARFIG